MSKTEKIIERIYIAGGIVLATVVIMSMSSCGTSQLTQGELINYEERKRNSNN